MSGLRILVTIRDMDKGCLGDLKVYNESCVMDTKENILTESPNNTLHDLIFSGNGSVLCTITRDNVLHTNSLS